MKPLHLLKETAQNWWKSDASVYAAAISFYTLLSIGPLITISIWLLGLFFEKEAVSGKIYRALNKIIDPSAAQLIQNFMVNVAVNRAHGFLPTIVGMMVTFYAAFLVVIQIKQMLDKLWFPLQQKNSIHFLKEYLIGFLGVLGLGCVFYMSVLIKGMVWILGENIFSIFPFRPELMGLSNDFAIFISVFVFIWGIFRYLPNQHWNWKILIPGALFTTSLFFVGKILFGWYISERILNNSYELTSALIAFVLWIYYSAHVLIGGAEFTKLFAQQKNASV